MRRLLRCPTRSWSARASGTSRPSRDSRGGRSPESSGREVTVAGRGGHATRDEVDGRATDETDRAREPRVVVGSRARSSGRPEQPADHHGSTAPPRRSLTSRSKAARRDAGRPPARRMHGGGAPSRDVTLRRLPRCGRTRPGVPPSGTAGSRTTTSPRYVDYWQGADPVSCQGRTTRSPSRSSTCPLTCSWRARPKRTTGSRSSS